MMYFGMPFSEVANLNSPDANINFIKYLQVLQGISLFIVPAFIIAYLINKQGLEYLKMKTGIKIASFFIVMIIMIVALPFINFLAEFNAKMSLPASLHGIEIWMKNSEEAAKVLTEKLLAANSFGQMLFNIFMIALIPAVGEELLFRGIFQRVFTDWTKNVHVAVFIAAFIFSTFHFQFYGFLPRLFLGIMLGYFFVWSKSLWLPILAHFTNNAFAVITYFLIAKGSIAAETENIGADPTTTVYTIISFLLMSSLLFILYRIETKKQ